MKVQKVLNNNVIVSLDDDGNEIVGMGKGIGFNRKPGDRIDAALIEKTYVLSNETLGRKFQQILAHIHLEHLRITEKIIDFAVENYGHIYSDVIYVSLTDHVSAAIERYEQGIAIENKLIWDIKRIYPDEFCVGMKGVEIIREETGLDILDDEAGFIALHFFNSRIHNPDTDVYLVTNLVDEMLEIVGKYFQIEFDVESISYYRFVTFLKYFAVELNTEKRDSEDDEMYSNVVQAFPETFQCAATVEDFLAEKYRYRLSKEEIFHLTVNIKRLIKSNGISKE